MPNLICGKAAVGGNYNSTHDNGLFSINVVKGIDDKQISYDDVEERQALESVAKKLFG